jgi:hypothetical protein
MIELMHRLIDGDHAYAVPGGDVYFDVHSYPDYGACLDNVSSRCGRRGPYALLAPRYARRSALRRSLRWLGGSAGRLCFRFGGRRLLVDLGRDHHGDTTCTIPN